MESETDWKRNRRFDHVFVVIRVARDASTHERELQQYVSAPRTYWSKEEAEAEVARLNRLNRSKGCEYFWTVSRVARR